MSDDDRVGEPPDGAGPWSDVRQAYMSAYDVRRFREVAGLGPDDALTWWEHHVFPREAARAIADGLGPAEALERSRRRQADRAAERRRQEAQREQEGRERARRAFEAERQANEEERRREESRRRRFETDDRVALIVESSSADRYRLRRSADSHWRVERFAPDANEWIDDCEDPVSGIERLAEHLEHHGRAAGSATVVGDVPVSPLRLVQPLRRVVAADFTLDGRRVSVAAAISLRGMLVPTAPDAWPDHRTVTDGVSAADVSAVGDLYLIRRRGDLIPIGFFDSDEAARSHPGWPKAAT